MRPRKLQLDGLRQTQGHSHEAPPGLHDLLPLGLRRPAPLVPLDPPDEVGQRVPRRRHRTVPVGRVPHQLRTPRRRTDQRRLPAEGRRLHRPQQRLEGHPPLPLRQEQRPRRPDGRLRQQHLRLQGPRHLRRLALQNARRQLLQRRVHPRAAPLPLGRRLLERLRAHRLRLAATGRNAHGLPQLALGRPRRPRPLGSRQTGTRRPPPRPGHLHRKQRRRPRQPGLRAHPRLRAIPGFALRSPQLPRPRRRALGQLLRPVAGPHRALRPAPGQLLRQVLLLPGIADDAALLADGLLVRL
mmetsp:Transcript_26282/g.85040  ORF Transcript_26282/g.85040 Transcript_26282/m.85040 type:complete len:298 (-) Transcript_26282:4279-5172(-)